MLKEDPVTLLLIIIFLYPLLKRFLFKFSSQHLKNSIEGVSCNIAFLISLLLGIHLVKSILLKHEGGIYAQIYDLLPQKLLDVFGDMPYLIYVVVLPIITLILYEMIKFIFGIFNNITFYPILDGIEDKLKEKSNFSKRIIGALFEFPRAVCYLIIVTFVLNFASILNISENLDDNLAKSNIYSRICRQIVIPVSNSSIAKKLPTIINDSFKIVTKEVNPSELEQGENRNVIIYYNGVTLEEGIQSNDDIDLFSRALVENEKTTREKAKKIYEWVSSEIKYDDDKAKKILNNDLTTKSGAVNTFNSKKGICFDFSCLFIAMCRANDIKVRIITGQGFNGEKWVNHAWNQVYISEKEQWINVDTTFAIGGNYFDSKMFLIDHKDAKIAGEW